MCSGVRSLAMRHVPAALAAPVCTQHLRTSARFVHKELELCHGKKGSGEWEAGHFLKCQRG